MRIKMTASFKQASLFCLWDEIALYVKTYAFSYVSFFSTESICFNKK